MGFWGKIFGKEKTKTKSNNQKKHKAETLARDQTYTLSNDLSFEISTDSKSRISLSSSPVGVSTGSTVTDFYVYEWFIKNSDEIFYVGKGRGNRYKAFHERAYEAEKIRKMYDTDIRFVGIGLTEEQALELETQEMARVLNETKDRLTNRIIPLFAKRGNGYDRSPNTPALTFERAPYFYANEIEEHYFGIGPRPFDEVNYEHLKAVVFITRNMRNELDIIYGGNPDQYINEAEILLSSDGKKILKNKFAKSVTAWIYIGDDYVSNFESDQERALERLGRDVPVYHLLDVWKLLREKFGSVDIDPIEEIPISPTHTRVSLDNIKNLHDWERGFDEGFSYWEVGEKERKGGGFGRAIELFDIARYNGYNAPSLYKSYAMTYRKLKDYDNEIAILNEAVKRFKSMEFKERREKALELKQK